MNFCGVNIIKHNSSGADEEVTGSNTARAEAWAAPVALQDIAVKRQDLDRSRAEPETQQAN